MRSPVLGRPVKDWGHDRRRRPSQWKTLDTNCGSPLEHELQEANAEILAHLQPLLDRRWIFASSGGEILPQNSAILFGFESLG